MTLGMTFIIYDPSGNELTVIVDDEQVYQGSGDLEEVLRALSLGFSTISTNSDEEYELLVEKA